MDEALKTIEVVRPNRPAIRGRRFSAAVLAGALFALAPGAQSQPAGSASANLWQPGDPGKPMQIQGQVVDSAGRPVGGATVDVRQADGNGEYHADRYRARLVTRGDGSYSFSTVLPGQYYGEKHIHVRVTHADHPSVETRILFKGDPHLDQATARDHAIALDEATVGDRVVLFGRFDVLLR